MVRRWRYEERGRYGGAKQRHKEDPRLQVVQIREPLGERHHEEESEEHLQARQYHPNLAQQLDKLPRGPLLRILPVRSSTFSNSRSFMLFTPLSATRG
jgi:hypothetical protein